MNDDTDFNKLLHDRTTPAPAANLATRISAAAAMRQNTPLIDIIIQEITAMIILPRPAYVLAFSLILGLLLGLQIEGDLGTVGQDWLSFADIEEGDWL